MTGPVVLGIDPSLHLGWAVHATHWTAPKFGLLELISPDEYGFGRFMTDARKRIRPIIKEHGVTHCFIEEPILIIKAQSKHRVDINLYSRMVLNKVEGAIEEECYALGLPDPRWVTIQKWRARLIGKTKAPPGITRVDARRDWWKRQAIAACAKRGWYTRNDNEADALGVTDYGLSTVCPIYRNRTDPLTRRAEVALTGDDV